ncbi:tRNA pseudouridine38-40 synthase [Gillisia mitskevichiae]|uniref:tRNA pseudouridine synthase A n=1 Tax=Gillisia mitskevichiae TaxID=270921 RepID=A0A495Q0I9_9FLAO|nr:tRNA pseudouridine(38-40) synthase TruA [Gillisia mitskevichiae]RKS56164.1 tRNA pseudouridine38-40 synthase [Gillisia mitskevichiae]
MRYFIELAYNGKAYHGWQNQPNAISVQETLEKVLFIALQVQTPLVGAGRTDAGVHASEYFAHFDSEKIAVIDKFIYKLNSLLPDDIAVYDLVEVNDEAHARFNATGRSYEYYVVQQKDPFKFETAHYVKNELDVDKMNLAASTLLNYTDFKCFSKSKTDVHTYNCKISAAQWVKEKDVLVFKITADRFLRNMVRAIVGTLLEIGLGKIPVSRLHEILVSRDRQEAGTSVPAKALFLAKIEYPTSILNK